MKFLLYVSCPCELKKKKLPMRGQSSASEDVDTE